MKKIKILMGAVAAVSMFGFTACNDNDFLTEKPKTVYTTANSYETVDQVKACVTNLYVHIRYWYQQDKFLKGLGADVMDTPYFRCTGNGFCNFSNWSPTSSSSNSVFNALYQLVNYANQALEGYSGTARPPRPRPTARSCSSAATATSRWASCLAVCRWWIGFTRP